MLKVNHHTQGTDHKTQISGNGLCAGKQLQGHLVNFIFQSVNGCIVFNDGCCAARITCRHGLAGVFQGNAHAGAHDQQPGAQ